MNKEFKKSKKIINLSKRGYIVYLTKSKISVNEGNVVYVQKQENQILTFNIPYLNTQVLILGYGTSISNQAASILSENNIMVIFVSNTFNIHAIITPDNSKFINKYAIALTEKLYLESKKIDLAKNLFKIRHSFNNLFLQKEHLEIFITDYPELEKELKKIDEVTTIEKILGHEGSYVKILKHKIEKEIGINDIDYEEYQNRIIAINSFFYGMAGVVLSTLGIPYYLHIYHGRTNNGSLKYDIADLIKGLSVPIAIESFNKKSIFYSENINHLYKILSDYSIDNHLFQILFDLTIEGLDLKNV